MPKPKTSLTAFNQLPLDDQVRLVEEVFENEVYPALRSHGGGLDIMDIDGYNVFIRYYGTCGGCPIKGMGTLEFMQMILREKIDPGIMVQIVEGNEFNYI